jgi:hypothetical protein
MIIGDSQDGIKKAFATAIGGKGFLLALVFAGAGFQGCSQDDAAPSAVETEASAGSVAPEGYEVANSEARDGLASFVADPGRQAGDERLVDLQEGSSKDLVTTPFGKVERRCVYELRAGEAIQDENTVATKTGTRTLASEQGCAIPGRKAGTTGNDITAPTTNGWVMAGWWNLPFWGSTLWSSLTVPRDPAQKRNQLLYFFSSFEDQSYSWIVQPVLQYGSNGAFGGRYWTIASWIVGPQNRVYYSTPVRTYAGDNLWGLIQGLNCTRSGQCTWSITMLNKTRKTSSDLRSNLRLPAMRSAQGGVLEAYNVNYCGEYPAQTSEAFTNIGVYDGASVKRKSAWGEALWSTRPSCGFDVTMKQGEASSVTLHWR